MELKVVLLKEGLSKNGIFCSKNFLEEIVEKNNGLVYGELGYPNTANLNSFDKFKRLNTVELTQACIVYSNLRIENDSLVADAKPLTGLAEDLLNEPKFNSFGIRALGQKIFDKEKDCYVFKEGCVKLISFDLIASENKEM